MTLIEHKSLVSFLEDYEGLIKGFCDIKDGRFSVPMKAELSSYIADSIKSEDGRLKMHRDEELHKKIISFHTAVLELIK